MIRSTARELAPAVGRDPLTEQLREQARSAGPRPYPADVRMPLREVLSLVLVILGLTGMVAIAFTFDPLAGVFMLALVAVCVGVLLGLGS